MSKRKIKSTDESGIIDHGTTPVELAKHPDGTCEATQPGLDIVGAGDSAARATEDMAKKIAELKERGEI